MMPDKPSEKPIVLCVDDEQNVVESMTLNLRKRYRVLTALSGPMGLEVLHEEPDVAVVISDMRMPEMDGAEFLAEVKAVAPTVVRMLLTGYSDIDAAMRAVNEGQIFRFLTKPCAPDHLLATLAAGVEQHRLITAEKVLLQKTLLGSVRAIIEIMALGNPMVLGRAVRIRDTVRKLSKGLHLEQPWRLEFAALLSQVGTVSLPDETLRKLYDGEELEPGESGRVTESTKTINRILGNIPRLEPVTSLLTEFTELSAGGATPDAASLEAGLLCAAIDLDLLEAQGHSLAQAIAGLRANGEKYGNDALNAIEKLQDDPGKKQVITVAPEALEDGMVLCEDLKTDDGMLILPRGFAVSASSREHVADFAGRVGRQIKVLSTVGTGPAPTKKSA